MCERRKVIQQWRRKSIPSSSSSPFSTLPSRRVVPFNRRSSPLIYRRQLRISSDSVRYVFIRFWHYKQGDLHGRWQGDNTQERRSYTNTLICIIQYAVRMSVVYADCYSGSLLRTDLEELFLYLMNPVPPSSLHRLEHICVESNYYSILSYITILIADLLIRLFPFATPSSFFIPPPFSGWLNCRGRIAFHRLYGRWENERATGCVYLTTILRTLSPPSLIKRGTTGFDRWRMASFLLKLYTTCNVTRMRWSTAFNCAGRTLFVVLY